MSQTMSEQLEDYEIEHDPTRDPQGWVIYRWTPANGWQEMADRSDLKKALAKTIELSIDQDAIENPPPVPDEEEEWLISRYRAAGQAIGAGVLRIRSRA